VTLTDAGPLIALIDADEPDHAACLEALDLVALPLVTTWPAFTEAMYLLGRAGGI
jgi:predicted nucleic acid-binding protein